MKKLTKALLPAIALLMASIVSLVGVTFAWFQQGTTAEVEDVTAGVQTAGGILVSWDGATWVSTLSIEDSNYLSISANGNSPRKNANTGEDAETNPTWVPDITYTPMSTIGAIGDDADGEIDFYTALLSQDKIASISKVASDLNKKLFKMTFYVSVNEACTIIAYQPGAGADSSDILTTVSSAQKDSAWATRVAFVHAGSGANSDEALGLGATASRSIQIWEPNYLNHTSSGWTDSGLNASDYALLDPNSVGFGYWGLKAPYNSAENGDALLERKGTLNASTGAIGDPATAESAYMAKLTNLTTNIKDIEISLAAGVNKIEIYVWLEGQDADCTNFIAGGDITFSLALSKKA